MRNIPTDIYIENEAVKNHGGEIAELGKKAMIVTGRHSSAVNGSLDDVRAVLESQGIGYVIYNDIEENPSVETVYTAATAAVKYGVICSWQWAAVRQWTQARQYQCLLRMG